MTPAKCLTCHGLMLLLTVSGCGASTGGESAAGVSEPSREKNVSTASGGNSVVSAASGSSSQVSDAMLELATADLAQRLGVEASAIAAARRETVQWRNGSAGCPKPGMMYTQMLIPGYRIELQVAGRSYWYHGRKGGEPFYCEHPEPPVTDGGGDATE